MDQEVINIKNLLKIFHKWLYFEDDHDITIPLSFAVSNFTNVDPGCFGIIAPSGSYKTEFIRSLGEKENVFIYPIDNLSSHTLISGMRGEGVHDLSIIPHLNKKLITTKDFTTLLTKQKDERSIILSDIRDMLDGYVNRRYGNGVTREYTDIHSSWLFGSTGVIENYASVFSVLGQRILFYKPKNNPKKVRIRARKNMNKTNEMRNELNKIMILFINYIISKNKDKLHQIGDNINEKTLLQIGLVIDFVAQTRAHVQMNFKGEVSGIPEIEFPTRLEKEIVKIISVHALLYEREVNGDDIKAGLKVLVSNVPSERLIVLKELYKEIEGIGISYKRMSKILKRSSYISWTKLEELYAVEIVDKIETEPNEYSYGIKPEYKNVCNLLLRI